MDAVRSERLEALDERVPDEVESLVHVFQSLRCDRLHAHERAADSSTRHGLQERRILSGLHGDLSEEDHVVRELCQSLHQGEALRANGF